MAMEFHIVDTINLLWLHNICRGKERKKFIFIFVALVLSNVVFLALTVI